METLTAATIATLLLTKTIEKLGEKVGEKLPELGEAVWKRVGNLKQKLQHNAPDTARAIERVTYQPYLVEQQPQDYGLEVLAGKIELAAKDPEVAQIIEALAAEVMPQLPSKVRNTIGEGIASQEGSIDFTGNEQDGAGSNDVINKLGVNVSAKGDISFSNNRQKG
jgi:hypothetical protein